jgi:hypothetical protein
LNKENYNSGSQQHRSEVDGSASASYFGIGGIFLASAKTVQEKSDQWKKEDKSLTEQVKYIFVLFTLLLLLPSF